MSPGASLGFTPEPLGRFNPDLQGAAADAAAMTKRKLEAPFPGARLGEVVRWSMTMDAAGVGWRTVDVVQGKGTDFEVEIPGIRYDFDLHPVPGELIWFGFNGSDPWAHSKLAGKSNSPGVQVGALGTYTDWNFPTPADPGYDRLTSYMRPGTDTYPFGVFWAMQFYFRNIGGGNDGAYMGLQTNGSGIGGHVAIFSVWSAIDASGPGIAQPFGGEGTGYQTMISYPWKRDNGYYLVIQQAGTPAGKTATAGPWWTASVTDALSGAVAVIGSIQVPAAWGALDWFTINWTEHYSVAPFDANDIPQSVCVFEQPVMRKAGVDTYPSSRWNHYHTGSHVTNALITDGGNYVRQEIGCR